MTNPPPAGLQGKKYKLVLLGDSGVGKSSLAQRLIRSEWVEDISSTVGASFYRYTAVVANNTAVPIDIWDTAGQERYKSLASMYYRGAAAALVVYDITSSESFERAQYWIGELTAQSPETLIMLVGNKTDLEANRRVTAAEARAYATGIHIMWGEASAKAGKGVREAFDAVAAQLVATNNSNNVREGGVIGQRVNETNGTNRANQNSNCC